MVGKIELYSLGATVGLAISGLEVVLGIGIEEE